MLLVQSLEGPTSKVIELADLADGQSAGSKNVHALRQLWLDTLDGGRVEALV